MSDAGYSSTLQPNSDASAYNELAFVVNSIMSRIATSMLVEVMAVHPGASLAIGTVDVKPAVNQVDGDLNGTPHGTIYALPYCRVMGGASAVICDPVVGDIGWAGFCSADISVVKSTMKAGNPGSRRRFDWSDGVYIGCCIGATPPTSYVQITGSVITVVNPTKISVQAPTVNIIAGTAVNLGATGGARVARVGDSVSGGVITSGSATVFAT